MVNKNLPPLTTETALQSLFDLGDPTVIAGQRRFGIAPAKPLGISIPRLRSLAQDQHDHALAAALWESGYHEARILASMVDEPELASREQLERWAADFDSWDICDQVVLNLFCRTSFAEKLPFEWAEDRRELVCRAGFVTIAAMAVHRKDLIDPQFIPFLGLIVDRAQDGRMLVSKAINWALRQVGKRSSAMWRQAYDTAGFLAASPDPAARWVGGDALRELKKVPEKLYIRSRWEKHK